MSKKLKLKKVIKSFVPETISCISGFPMYISRIRILVLSWIYYILSYIACNEQPLTFAYTRLQKYFFSIQWHKEKTFKHLHFQNYYHTINNHHHHHVVPLARISLTLSAECMCYNQTGDISTLDGTPLKLVDKFTYLGSSVSSTEKDIDTRLTKEWTAINRLSIIWKSDLTDKMKRSFFQEAAVSILLYGCTTWTLTKRLEKKLDGNYTRMLRAILNKS